MTGDTRNHCGIGIVTTVTTVISRFVYVRRGYVLLGVRDRLGTPVTLVTNRFTDGRFLRSLTRAPLDALQTPLRKSSGCLRSQLWRGDALRVNSGAPRGQ